MTLKYDQVSESDNGWQSWMSSATMQFIKIDHIYDVKKNKDFDTPDTQTAKNCMNTCTHFCHELHT